MRIDAMAVGFIWYVDGESGIFAEVIATHREEKRATNVKLGEPFTLHNLRIEMLAGDFANDCTLRVTRIETWL